MGDVIQLTFSENVDLVTTTPNMVTRAEAIAIMGVTFGGDATSGMIDVVGNVVTITNTGIESSDPLTVGEVVPGSATGLVIDQADEPNSEVANDSPAILTSAATFPEAP